MWRNVGCIGFSAVLAAAMELESAGATSIIVSDSSVISCRCADNSFHCDDLSRSIHERPGVAVSSHVRNFLDSLGFFHARWDTLAPGRYIVAPHGRAAIVSETIAGVEVSFPRDSVFRARLPRPYDAGEIQEHIAAIGRHFAERGYPFAAIEVTIGPSRTSLPPAAAATSPDDSLAVVYTVATDRKCLFAAPRIRGATATRPKLLRCDIPIRRGELFDIRKIERMQRQLRFRPYIAAVSIGKFTVEPDALRESNEPRDVDFVTVPVLVKDRSGLGMEGALGFNSRQGENAFFQGDVTLSFLNLFHSGESAYFSYAGDGTYQTIETEVSKPWFFGAPLTGSASFTLEIHKNKYGYLTGEAAALAELEKGWRIGVRLKTSEAVADSGGTDASERTWRYTGADLLLSRFYERPMDGVFSHELSLATGGGIAQRKKNLGRSHVDFTAGVHVPLWLRHAARVRFISKHLISNEERLIDAEMYRVGGVRSVRGYSENEFAFRTVVYSQFEYLFYYNPTGSVYIFMDGGLGFKHSPNLVRWSQRRDFFGYGVGMRAPVRIGTLSFEWARSREDTKSWGRMHVMVRNPLYHEME